MNFKYTRCQNVNRKSKSVRNDDEDEEPRASKKSKVCPEKHTYPSVEFQEDDDVAFERKVSLMQQEVSKQKPQAASVTSLMQHTFTKRRQWILDEMQSVKEICEKYPCLSKPVFV